MLYSLPAETERFTTQVRDFLTARLDPELIHAARATTGVHSQIDAGQRWHKILASRGWSAPSWPREHGGPGWTALQQHIFSMECSSAGAPLLFNMGIRHLGPILMAHGTDAQKHEYLPRILRGEDIWCQGYSEPTAGSDLAALKLSARRDGDTYVLNGSKMWTTGAQFATHMFCLARTVTGGAKQEGISFLLLPMSTPGIQIRPITSISGDHEFNQVFFDNAAVPICNRVGPENEGWRVAKDLMQFARSNNVNTGWVRETLEKVKHIAARECTGYGIPLAEDPDFQRSLAAAEINLARVEVMNLRLLSNTHTDNPGALSSMLKALGSELKQTISELQMHAVAHYGLPFQPAVLTTCANVDQIGPTHALTAMPSYLNERAATIYSGASEVQRNVLAKRVLGLR
jgi:alkylation response protein AidB-like acyl-CoA dehydrogenase